MKNILLFTLSFFLLSITKAQNTAQLASILPSDVIMVFSTNLKQMNSKINMTRIKNLEMIQYAYTGLKQELGKDSSILKKVYQDPKLIGLDLNSSVTVAFRKLDDGTTEEIDIKPMFIFNLSSAKKFEKMLKQKFSENNEYDDFLESNKKWKYKTFKTYSSAFTWNKNRLYIFPIDYDNRETINEEIESALQLSKSKSLLTNASFINAKITESDLNYWLDYNKFLKMTTQISPDSDPFFNYEIEKLRGTETEIGLNFNTGVVVLDALGKVNKTLRDQNKAVYSKKVNPDFFNLIHGDSLLALYSMSFDIKELKSSLETNYDNLLDTLENLAEREIIEELLDSNEIVISLNEQIDNDTISWLDRMNLQDSLDVVKDSLVEIEMSHVEENIDSILGEFKLSREEAWDFFKGDFLISSTGTYDVIDTITTYDYIEDENGELVYKEVEKTQKSPVPLFVGMASINLEDKCSYLLSKLEEDGFIKKEADYYYISYTKYDYFIKQVDNILLFTNDLSLVKDVKNSNEAFYSKKLSTDLIKKSTTFPIFGFVDIEKILAKIPSDSGSDKFVAPAAATFQDIEFKSILVSNNDMNSDFSLNFKKKNDNSIHILLDLANEYFKLFSGI